MRSNYLPKVAVAILALSVVLVTLSGQSVHVAANHVSPQNCYYYNNNSNYYWYYYYWYPYYSCSYTYYYPYYSYYYPYYSYYGYSYPYYSSSYYSTPSNYQLTVATDPSNLGTVTGGGTFSQGSSASFSVTQNVIQSSPSMRYVFSHWSGDYSGVGTSGTLTMNGARKVTAVYQQQYYLTVNAQPQSVPAPQGAGWYNAGDTATLTSPGQTVNADSGSRLVFQGWSIDGQNAQPSATLTVMMDAPHSVNALFTQQYYLNVLTDQGVASGQGWYDAGTSAQIYVTTPASTTYGVRYVFNGWQGDVQSNSQSASVLMDKPKTAIASWGTDSTVLYLTIVLGIIAALVAVAIVAFVARGRGTQPVPTQAPPPAQVPASAPAHQAPPPKKRHNESHAESHEEVEQ